MTEFSIIRVSDKKSGGKIKSPSKLVAALGHNLRAGEVANADPVGRVHVLRGDKDITEVMDRYREMMSEPGMGRVRSNAVLVVEILLGMSPEAGRRLKAEDRIDEWADEAVAWFEVHFPAENILSAVLHEDETTPHIHILVVPIDRTPRQRGSAVRLNAARWFDGRPNLRRWQTLYGEFGAEFGLVRGVFRSPANHKQIQDLRNELDLEVQRAKERSAKLEKELATVSEDRRRMHASLSALSFWSRDLVEVGGTMAEPQYAPGPELPSEEPRRTEEFNSIVREMEIGGQPLWFFLEMMKEMVERKAKKERELLKKREEELKAREESLLAKEAELQAEIDAGFEKGRKRGLGAGFREAAAVREFVPVLRRVEQFVKDPEIQFRLKALKPERLYRVEEQANTILEEGDPPPMLKKAG